MNSLQDKLHLGSAVRHRHGKEGNPRVRVRSFFLMQALTATNMERHGDGSCRFSFPTALPRIEYLTASRYESQWKRSNRVLPFSFVLPTSIFQDPTKSKLY